LVDGREKQVPPLRCASVGMTSRGWRFSLTGVAWEGRTAGSPLSFSPVDENLRGEAVDDPGVVRE
jgi:hypothetical protein